MNIRMDRQHTSLRLPRGDYVTLAYVISGDGKYDSPAQCTADTKFNKC